MDPSKGLSPLFGYRLIIIVAVQFYDTSVQCYRAKMTHEKIEILNYDTSIHGEHVFRLDGTPGV